MLTESSETKNLDTMCVCVCVCVCVYVYTHTHTHTHTHTLENIAERGAHRARSQVDTPADLDARLIDAVLVHE